MCGKERRADERTGADVTAENGNTLAIGEHLAKTQGLTNSSSATEAGQVKRAMQRRRDGQLLFAGARG